MNIPAATRIDRSTNERAKHAHRRTNLKMADLLRIGLMRVLQEFEDTGKISSGDGSPIQKKGGKR
jgi:hypothetical protein